MNIEIPGVIYEPLERYPDERGYFSEVFRSHNVPAELLQANHSHSKANVVRGLHYHRKQADLWYVASGRIRAAMADLRTRRDPPATATVDMTVEAPATLYIPPGVAHGFAALTDCDLIYWVTQEFDASDEFGVAWNDPALGIDWGVEDPIVSERDRTNAPLSWDEIPSF